MKNGMLLIRLKEFLVKGSSLAEGYVYTSKFIRDKVNWYLDELVCEMENLTGKRASITTFGDHLII